MELPESLVSKILTKKCILFLGAGATKESGGLLGNELAKYIYSKIGDVGIPYRENLSRYTQQLVNAGYREDIERIVRERLKGLKPNEEFCKLADIPWKSIYSTNYDDLVEKAYEKQRYYECIVEDVNNIDGAKNHTGIPLYKINGDINQMYDPQRPLVITLNDLKGNALKNEKIVQQLMRDLNDTYVFVGYSFEDDNEIVTKILDAFCKTSRWESVKEKYVILPKIPDDLKMDLECYRIKYIKGTADEFFSILSKNSNDSYKVKLAALKKNYSSNMFLKDLEPRTLNNISECFDIYISDAEYPSDGKYFYRGGMPSWGIVKDGYDVNRRVNITKENKLNKYDTYTLCEFVRQISEENKLSKIVLKGPAVSGKSTALFRCAFNLMELGILSMFFKQQSIYKKGTLFHVHDKIKEPFVVIVDNLYVDYREFMSMIDDAEKNSLPIIFIAAIRYAEWNNCLSNYNKRVLEPFDATIEMLDNFEEVEAEHLVDMMGKCGVIHFSNGLEKKGFTKRFLKSQNVIEILLELIDRNNIIKSLCSEYEASSKETRLAYGLVSIIYKYGMKLRWELLEHTIAETYEFSWDDFVDKIIKGDAKGNLFQEEIQGNYYLSGRHRYISEIFVRIHYQGNYSLEIEDLKKMILAAHGNRTDERFVGSVIHSIISDEGLYYSNEQILELLDYAIDNFNEEENAAYINHLKGELFISKREYLEAITCFDANVQNGLNVEYSLHSLGKSYYYMAQSEEDNVSEFRIHIDFAIEKLLSGVEQFRKNEYYYALLITIFGHLEEVKMLSEKNIQQVEILKSKADKYIGLHKFVELQKKEKNNVSIDM